ncbi:PEP/pyruvate-binding domain-containing protein [Micromonospora sp. STR1s_6]|uniref:Phosphoenolpyruvate synthase n=1 Tax=Micromonospora tarensis TaxID=2806100 RepID=A0ABS1YAW4_9ACTN|nr:PEP/pyruvate-binding domain-containing protein [Micromonospora tarensis]MBM0274381.1 PEP/pyruvate-binding domain-containing protein [Micromonospora tarensis]
MRVIGLSEVTADMIDLVGGKAAGLGELIRQGERVPDGFCVTTEAHRTGTVPTAEVVAAYQRLGAGPVAVRSSATAEDLPDASFAGQQDTVLNVTGTAGLVAAIETCWASLHSDRATAYRDAHQIGQHEVGMAVVVQRMVTPTVAGVLFTANPLTGRRDEMVVDAAPGLGTTVVDGATTVDHYVLDDVARDDTGCLTSAQLARLRASASGWRGTSAARRTWSGRSTPTTCCGCCSPDRSPACSPRHRPPTSPSPASTWSSGTSRACCNRSPRWAWRPYEHRSPRCSPRSASGSRSSTSAAGSTAT